MITHPCVKVNLGLNVLRKRPDGFHDLETLFLPYPGIHDTLEIIPADGFSETSASLFARYGSSGDPAVSGTSGVSGAEGHCVVGPGLGSIDGQESRRIVQAIREDGRLMITIARSEGVDWDPLKDLTAKAYALLEEDFRLPPVKIFLEKTSPVGAGLGGGSADAAYALRMLSELFGLGLDDGALAAYAARLGSDCAFFVYCRPMLGEGRGEVLTPCDDIAFEIIGTDAYVAGYKLRVTVPEGISVSTREAYSGIVPREAGSRAEAFDADANAVCRAETFGAGANTIYRADANTVCRAEAEAPPTGAMSAVPAAAALPSLREILALPVDRWRDTLVNDFETTVFAAHPELAALKQRLYDGGAVYAAMSGSGSALFELR